jgi:three-Cys-motif partner protein
MPRIVGDWTRDKLKIIEDYLPHYLSATTSALDRIYIDAFSGPGTNQLRNSRQIIDGSPLIALDAKAANGSRFTKLYFIEQDRSLAEELRAQLAVRDVEKRAEVLVGDVNEVLPRLVRQRIHPRAPTFVLLDTVGIDPAWSTVEAISPWRTELLINFPLGMSIYRNEGSSKIVPYFGTTEAVEILRSRGTGRARKLLDLYKRRLVSLGYQYPTEDDRLVKTQSNKRLYYLVFASKVDVGERIMRAVLKQPDARGQQRLL